MPQFYRIDITVTTGWFGTLGDVQLYLRAHILEDIRFLGPSKISAVVPSGKSDSSDWQSTEKILDLEEVSSLLKQLQELDIMHRDLNIAAKIDTSDVWTNIQICLRDNLQNNDRLHTIDMFHSGIEGADALAVYVLIKTLFDCLKLSLPSLFFVNDKI